MDDLVPKSVPKHVCYAPHSPGHSYLRYGQTEESPWHKVNPLNLTRAVCGPATIVNLNKIASELPEGKKLCKGCARITPPDIGR